jgi:hypothetical protein
VEPPLLAILLILPIHGFDSPTGFDSMTCFPEVDFEGIGWAA